jgi:pimeloyl-ACP methyl ester carboxylesterase
MFYYWAFVKERVLRRNVGAVPAYKMPKQAPISASSARRLTVAEAYDARSQMPMNFPRPSPLLTGVEAVRSFTEFAVSVVSLPVLATAPRGRGAPVLVLPGLSGGDGSTSPLRWFLGQLGHQAYGWGLGRNMGPNGRVLEGMSERLRAIAEAHEQPVSLVGWSMGGLYARDLAARHPELVRQIVTLGSPHRLYQRTDIADLPVPVTAIYSRSDGVVPWRACLNVDGPRRENIEVVGSHFGYGHNPSVLYIIADRLALPAGKWRPYGRRAVDVADQIAS